MGARKDAMGIKWELGEQKLAVRTRASTVPTAISNFPKLQLSASITQWKHGELKSFLFLYDKITSFSFVNLPKRIFYLLLRDGA